MPSPVREGGGGGCVCDTMILLFLQTCRLFLVFHEKKRKKGRLAVRFTQLVAVYLNILLCLFFKFILQ